MQILVFIIVLLIALAVLGFIARAITSKLELPGVINTVIYVLIVIVSVMIALNVA